MPSEPNLVTSRAPLDLDAYRRDLWPRDTLRLAHGQRSVAPALVAWPKTQDQVRQALDLAERRDLAVVPYGAGSGVCGAAAGRSNSLVVDLKAMNQVLELDPRARTVRVQAGILGQHLEDWLAPRGWMTAHSPSSIWCSTVGGYIAARGAGQFSSRYGVFDDMLLAARAETPAGTLATGAWTPKGSEDLLPVLCGSEGALGVVTDVLVRIAPLPQTRWLRGYAFPNLQSAWSAMRELMQAGLWPAVLRLYDPLDTRLNRTASGPSKARSDKGLLRGLRRAVSAVPALRTHLLDLPLALPGLVNAVAGQIGKDVALIVGFEGQAALVDAQVALAKPILAGARDLGAGAGERWFAHRHAVSYKLAPIFVAGGFADTMEVAAPWSRLEALHDGVRQAIGSHALVMAHFSHAYPEGCSIYFSFAGRGSTDTYDALWSDALAAARLAGATVTHHHGVGQLKSKAAALEAGAAVRVWRELKSRWDPDDRMNPGRLFPPHQPELPGPLAPDPTTGPVFSVDMDSMLAEVDPAASPQALDHALAAQGLAPRLRPDRPLATWLPALRRTALDVWEVPLFAVQARFDDGVSARIGPAPRSAAGPDLRLPLLRRATAELVQIPVRHFDPRVPDVVVRPVSNDMDPRDLRPTWRKDDRWGFAASIAPLSTLIEATPARGKPPRRSPRAACLDDRSETP